jgi:hypothetical protein
VCTGFILTIKSNLKPSSFSLQPEGKKVVLAKKSETVTEAKDFLRQNFQYLKEVRKKGDQYSFAF